MASAHAWDAEASANGVWPSETQRLLLRAALLSGPAAVDAWEAWLGHADWEAGVEHGSFRLLPLLYTNLRRGGVAHPSLQKLKGVYRQAWATTNRLFHRMHG